MKIYQIFSSIKKEYNIYHFFLCTRMN